MKVLVDQYIRIFVTSWTVQPARLLCTWNSPGKNNGVSTRPFYSRSSQPRDRTQVSLIAGGLFTILSNQGSPRNFLKQSNSQNQTGEQWLSKVDLGNSGRKWGGWLLINVHKVSVRKMNRLQRSSIQHYTVVNDNILYTQKIVESVYLMLSVFFTVK